MGRLVQERLLGEARSRGNVHLVEKPALAADTVEKVKHLLVAYRELIDKLTAVHDEMDSLIAGRSGIAINLKEMEAAFDAAWCTRYAPGDSNRYLWAYQKDRPHMKRFIQQIGCAELPARFFAYIKHEDKFLLEHRHPFKLFVLNVNSYVLPVNWREFELASEATGCTHTPKCQSEQACTKRQMQSMRTP